MKIIISIFLFICLIAGGQALAPRPNLVPYPNQITLGSGTLLLSPCSIAFQFTSIFRSIGEIPQYYHDILDFYYNTTFPQFRCQLSLQENTLKKRIIGRLAQTNTLIVNIKTVEALKPELPSKSTNESYTLTLDSQEWVLEAENYHGFLRGLETFFQLLEPTEDSDRYQISYLPIHIQDAPSFGFRGVMIDTARHFIQMGTLKHVLDGMLFHKLNVFHWHIVDEESFPLQLESFPEITASGAYSPKEIYSREDVEEIIDYARMRGIRVIPEVDSPAHSRSWGFSQKLSDIALTCPIWANYNGQLDPTLDKTYDVVKGVLEDVTSYFADEYIHLGGDEVSYSCWEEKPWIKAFMGAHNITSGIELQNYYKNREKTLLTTEKSTIFWVKDANFDYQENDILQYWGASTQYSLIQNYSNPVILSPYDYLYIDVGYGNVFGNPSWAPFITWKDIYKFNPYPAEIEKSRILGGEVTLWAEVNSDATTDNHLWSRSSAFAERMWNALINNGDADIVARLTGNERRLTRRGFYASPVTSQYCGLHLDVCFPS